MIRSRLLATLVTTVAATLGLAGGAQAAIVTVGSPLTGGTWVSIPVLEPEAGHRVYAFFNSHVSAGDWASPVDGAIIGWNVREATGGPFYLRVLNPTIGGKYGGAGTSAPASPGAGSIAHFTAALPIKAGQTVGLDVTNPTDKVGVGLGTGTPNAFSYFEAPLPEGGSAAAVGGQSALELEIGFNVEVQPVPTITAIGPIEGPAAGGTSVTIDGTDLENATGVTIGGVAAAGLTQETDSRVRAVAPAGTPNSEAPVVVTTLAGSATASAKFFYQPAPKTPGEPAEPGESAGPVQTAGPTRPSESIASTTAPAPVPTAVLTEARRCVVPKLIAKSLRAAKAGLRAANCKLGNVAKPKSAKGSTARVATQSPKPGVVLPARGRVSLKLA